MATNNLLSIAFPKLSSSQIEQLGKYTLAAQQTNRDGLMLIMQSVELGENWRWRYVDQEMV